MRRWARFEVPSRLVWYIGMLSCDCTLHRIEKCRVDENSWSKPPHLSRQSLAAVREWKFEVRYCEISLEFLSKKTTRESFVFTRLVKIKELGQGYEKQQNTTYQVVGLKRDQQVSNCRVLFGWSNISSHNINFRVMRIQPYLQQQGRSCPQWSVSLVLPL